MKKTIIFLILFGILLAVPFLVFGQYDNYYTSYSTPLYSDYNYGYNNGYSNYSNYGNYNNYSNYNNGYNYVYPTYDYSYNSYNNSYGNYGYDYVYPTYDYSYNSYNAYPYYNDNYNYGYNYSYPYNYNYNSYNYNNGYNNNYSNCSYYGCGNTNSCASNSYKSCSGSNLYWYNSCGTIGSLVSNCGSSYTTGNKRCSGNWVQEEKIDRGCGGNSCYSNTVWNNIENCATNGRTCSNGSCSNTNSNMTVSCNISPSYVNVGQEVVFYANIYGGSGNYLYSWSGDCSGSGRECRSTFQSAGSRTATINVTSNSQTVSAVCSLMVGQQDGWYTNSYYACYDNDLYWYDRYNNRTSKYQDCESNLGCTYASPYCSGNTVYRQKTCQTGQCVSNACKTTSYTQSEFVETCNSGMCSNGHCYPWVY